MKKYFFIIIILFSINNLFSQSNLISFDSDVSIESNALNNSILNKFLFGGVIDQELKDSWLSYSKMNNTVNAEVNNGIRFTKKLYSGDLIFSIFDKNHINMNISRDLLSLILYGNFDYQNELLNFKNSNLRINRYQQYKVGYNIRFKKNHIKLAFSYLQGNHNISIIIDEGSLFTYPNGESLDINYNINSFSTDTSSYNFFNSNGNGAAIDFSTQICINKSKINLYVFNLGFIKWNDKSINNSIDSSYNFNGITINSFNNLYDSIIDFENNYSLNLIDQNIKYKSYTAADIGVCIEQKIRFYNIKKIVLGINTKWQPLIDDSKLSFNKLKQGIYESNYKPKLYISTIIPYKNFNLLCNLYNGGYSKTTNLDLGIEINQKFTYIFGTKSINQMLKENNKQFFSLYLKIIKEI